MDFDGRTGNLFEGRGIRSATGKQYSRGPQWQRGPDGRHPDRGRGNRIPHETGPQVLKPPFPKQNLNRRKQSKRTEKEILASLPWYASVEFICFRPSGPPARQQPRRTKYYLGAEGLAVAGATDFCSGMKFSSSQQRTNPSVTDFNCSQRVRIPAASFFVI